MAIKVGAPGTKTVRFEAGAWYDKKTGYIHLTIPEHESFHTTVSEQPGLGSLPPEPVPETQGSRRGGTVA